MEMMMMMMMMMMTITTIMASRTSCEFFEEKAVDVTVGHNTDASCTDCCSSRGSRICCCCIMIADWGGFWAKETR